jgi:hypothetical protein
MFSFLFRHIFALLPVHDTPIQLRRWYVAAPSHESRAQSETPGSHLPSGWYTTIEALAYVAPDQELLTLYLERTFQLRCQGHESSMRYGGGFYLAGRNHVAHVHVIVVAAGWLGWQIPKHYRKESWYYASVTCPDTHADASLLKAYQAVDASRYHIV